MYSYSNLLKNGVRLTLVGAGALFLSGCVAAAIPLVMATSVAGLGVAGFGMYKAVQLSSGGSVKIGFATGPDGKKKPPEPLPAGRRVAVWPGSGGEVEFSEHLQRSGRFDVVPPATVARTLAAGHYSTDLKQLTDGEMSAEFQHVCNAKHVDFVFADRDLGISTNDNMWSLSRANVTAKSDLFGYGCHQQSIVWRDQIIIVMEVGGHTEATPEVQRIAGDAWAERLLSAHQT